MADTNEACPRCKTALQIASGIGPYCPNNKCPVIDGIALYKEGPQPLRLTKMSPPKYQFIPTDQISDMGDAEKDLASVHRDSHNPEDHLCFGCVRLEKEECWAERHGEEPTKRDGARRMDDLSDRDCHCSCHFLIDQCRFSQTAVKNDGRPMYRLETDYDGWSIVLPAAVYDSFMDLTEEQRDEAVTALVTQAKQVKKAEENRS